MARLAYFCMESLFSVRPLAALMRAGHDVRFVMRPVGGIETRKRAVLRRHRAFDVPLRRLLGLPVPGASHSPFALARDHDIPAYLVGDASRGAVAALLRAERVDVAVVAFFNQLFRPSLLEAVPHGFVNLHPSLLPRYRGPAPLFWTFRDGAHKTGLTVHRIAAGEDNGAVLAAAPVDLPLGIAGEDLLDELSARGEELVVGSVDRALDDDPGVIQDERLMTRAPRPSLDDGIVDATLSAERAFHFVRGVGRWNHLVVDAGGVRYRALDAVSYDPGQGVPGEHALIGDVLHLGRSDGRVALHVRPG
jgi:methionyl-tRNA formyltransferase